MIKIEKAKLGEIENIIKVANKSFRPIRDRKFDFHFAVPFIYGSKKDYSELHHVLRDDDKIISLVGNLIREIKVGKKTFKYSNVGTVCTLPKYRGNGYMKKIMKKVEQENVDEKVVFSILTGNRKRYNHIGYESSGFKFEYTFEPDIVRYIKSDKEIKLADVLQEDYDTLFDLYKKHSPFCLREKEEFDRYFLDKRIALRKVIFEDKIVGYFATKKGKIIELIISDTKLLTPLLIKIFETPIDSVTFSLNPLRKKYIEYFEKVSCKKQMVESNIYKIYDTKLFIEMLLEINKNIVKLPDCSTCIKVDDEVLKVTIKDGKYNVKKSNSVPQEEFTKSSFVRYCMSITPYDHTPRIFPLLFDIDSLDMF